MSDTCLLLVSSELPLNERRQFEKCERKGIVHGGAYSAHPRAKAFDNAADDLIARATTLGANVVTSLQVVHLFDGDGGLHVYMHGDAWFAPHVGAVVPASDKPRVGFA